MIEVFVGIEYNRYNHSRSSNKHPYNLKEGHIGSKNCGEHTEGSQDHI